MFVTLANTVIFSLIGGCGFFYTVPMVVGWHIIRMCCGSFFADNHAHIVATVSAFLSACFLAGFLAAIAAAARKKGRLASQAGLASLFIIGGLLYIGLGLLRYPEGPCP